MKSARLILSALLSSLISVHSFADAPAGEPPEKQELPKGGISESARMVAKIHFNAGRYELALSELTSAAGEDPSNAMLWFDIGVVNLVLKRIDEAEGAFRRAVELDPQNADALLNLGVLAMRADDLEGAEEALKKAVELKPDWPEARANLGGLYVTQGKKLEAMREFQAALKANPSFRIAHFNVATLYAQSGDWEAAEKSYRKILEIDPGAFRARLELAAIYRNNLKRPVKAIYHYYKVVELNPSGPAGSEARKAIEEMGRE